MDCVNWTIHGQRFSSRSAFSYILEQGSTLASFYPTDFAGMAPCRREESQMRLFISNYHLLQPDDEENLKLAVALIGPISVSIRFTKNFFFYMSGIFYDYSCLSMPNITNHAVLLVGYGVSRGAPDFWIIQNSWGIGWGENGYARIVRNSVIDCGITSAAIYPVL